MAKCTILSIDGGGIRGIIPATILKCIENEIKTPIYNKYDIGSGSSAGALIMLQLNGLKFSAEKVLTHFTDPQMIGEMFHKRFLRFVSLFYGPIYDGVSKSKMIESILSCDMKFTNIDKPTLITAYDLTNKQSVVFKSTGGSDSQRDATIAQVADASSAAPTYFPPVKIGNDWLVDGGIAANDPCMCALSYALKLGYPLSEIKVLSLGTGLSKKQSAIRKKHVKSSDHWGKVSWLKHGIIDDLMRGNTTISEYQCRTLLAENHLRINPDLEHADSAMDNITKENIKNLVDVGIKSYNDNKEKIIQFLC
ncbi:patatin-like phospholipase family protein [Thiotrichales bacterium 19S3-7]|nr:patatin-like phospholipase family protein [Thiotrichales bacterium 19S3-7]MCF6801946.1 patatin-like phospholipase family protein [Thiotrichales bacterium 19S3-11]